MAGHSSVKIESSQTDLSVLESQLFGQASAESCDLNSAVNYWKCLEIAGNDWECLKMTKNKWKWMKISGNGWNWLEMAEHGWIIYLLSGNNWTRFESA